MSITDGTFGYGFLAIWLNSSIEIPGTSGSEPLPSSSGGAFGVDTLTEVLAVKLTLELLVDSGVGATRRCTRAVPALVGSGIATFSGSSNVRLPFCFATIGVCEASFAGAFGVGCVPFVVAFVFSWGWSPSLELVEAGTRAR